MVIRHEKPSAQIHKSGVYASMSAGFDKLKHIVVLMMENRSFDHMLGGLKARVANMQGFVQSYYEQRRNVQRQYSRRISSRAGLRGKSRSLPPLPATTRMIIRWLSISLTLRRASSARRMPVP